MNEDGTLVEGQQLENIERLGEKSVPVPAC